MPGFHSAARRRRRLAAARNGGTLMTDDRVMWTAPNGRQCQILNVARSIAEYRITAARQERLERKAKETATISCCSAAQLTIIIRLEAIGFSRIFDLLYSAFWRCSRVRL